VVTALLQPLETVPLFAVRLAPPLSSPVAVAFREL
jgi:hypothetical protein